MSNFQHGWGDSISNEGKAFSVLCTQEGFAMVPLSTGGNSARLECFFLREGKYIVLSMLHRPFYKQDTKEKEDYKEV
jgi:hypothetical protein